MKECLRYYFFLFICLGIFCCNKETEKQVGQEYLDSEAYREFAAKTNKEIVQKEKLNDLPAHLQLLVECQINELHLPLIINRNQLAKLQSNSPECDIISQNQDARFELSALGHSNVQDIDLYWVLVNWESMYTKQEVLAVSFKNDSLVSFQTVAVFQNDLSKNIATDSEARLTNGNLLITSKMERRITYPLEQRNTITTVYTLSSGGIIQEKHREVTNDKESRTEKIIQNFRQLPNCTQLNKMSFPIEFTHKELTALKKSRVDCNFSKNEFSFVLLGKSVFNDLDVFWVVIDWRSLLNNENLFVATVRNDSLVSFKKVGVFQKSFKKDVSTKSSVQLTGGIIRITSEINSNVDYPIKQNTVMTSEFSIDPQGTIREL